MKRCELVEGDVFRYEADPFQSSVYCIHPIHPDCPIDYITAGTASRCGDNECCTEPVVLLWRAPVLLSSPLDEALTDPTLTPQVVITDNSGFVVKDTGNKQAIGGGMVRNAEGDRVDFTLAVDGPMFNRFAAHLTKGAKIYGKRNWMKVADGTPEEKQEALARFNRSAFRHFMQWLNGDRDEDHAAAVFFNLNCAEYLKEKL